MRRPWSVRGSGTSAKDNGRQIVAEQLYATLKTNHGDIEVQLFAEPRAQDGAELRRAGHGRAGVDATRRPARRPPTRSTTARSSTG